MQASESGARPPDDGIVVEVDLDALIESVMLGPAPTKDDMEVVIELTRKVGFGTESAIQFVRTPSLRVTPILQRCR